MAKARNYTIELESNPLGMQLKESMLDAFVTKRPPEWAAVSAHRRTPRDLVTLRS